ncbi:MAG: hypothetical protein QOE77_2503 [Blastocatellia bacterium]|jgi:hypothetical protein|nr:hypothetical protein [Blastocatellia bacterium]
MREIRPADELLNRAFELAYFILGDRPASIYVATTALDKLKTALANQGRRLYYTPLGRLAHPGSRTKVNLSEIHLLQRLVYIESEFFERLLEGQQKNLQQEDLIIRYVKHLIRITTKQNSFYVTLGLCRLLYNYNTGETSEIYNLVLQDPERIRDDYYYRSRKQRLMQAISDRFGSLIKTQRGFRGEQRFQPQEDSQPYAELVRQCLTRFTPWRSDCVLPPELDPNSNVITQLLFEDGDPDKEHRVELNRIHTLIHPQCLGRLTAALGLDPTDKRLELPFFFVPDAGARPSEDRFTPAELTEGERDVIRRHLDKNAIHRKKFSGGPLSLLIDGQRLMDFDLDRSGTMEFDLEHGTELVEIQSVGPVEADEDTSLAVCLLAYDRSGILPVNTSVALSKSLRLDLKVLPFPAASSKTRRATLRVGYQHEMPAQHIAPWFKGLVDLRPRRGLHLLQPAPALLFIVLCLVGLWFYFQRGTDVTNPAQVAQLQADRRGAALPNMPPAEASPGQTQTETAAKEGRSDQNSGLNLAGRTGPGRLETSEIERTRGIKRRNTPAMLLAVRRLYVDSLGDDPFSVELRKELIGHLRASTHFEVVENRDDADAVFKGNAIRVPGRESNSLVVLELVNATGQVVWSLSSRKEGRILPRDSAVASATISKALLREIKRLQRTH